MERQPLAVFGEHGQLVFAECSVIDSVSLVGLAHLGGSHAGLFQLLAFYLLQPSFYKTNQVSSRYYHVIITTQSTGVENLRFPPGIPPTFDLFSNKQPS
jgi:hypothetical protein